jgi:hypothetical protein
MFKTKFSVERLPGIYYQKRPVWKLSEDLVFDSKVLGKWIVVNRGFITDLESVPRIPLAWWLFGGIDCASSVVHDFLLEKTETEKEICDKVFLEGLEAEGVPRIQRNLMYRAVRLFGGRGDGKWKEQYYGRLYP